MTEMVESCCSYPTSVVIARALAPVAIHSPNPSPKSGYRSAHCNRTIKFCLSNKVEPTKYPLPGRGMPVGQGVEWRNLKIRKKPDTVK